ncbi:hypothetical protein psal_cds_430 [Pandoravirus salinus]|uniref:Uncharacterized protein n=1 Tax=Pandoravirus salinus TaxID=1349410 RepID=S4VXI1_9VIRU|nr:hypothetical protein psal_cds_430 [Pandoravirus salinus]AGO84166.1 hypothetical protein psal_cds_430 [Pandoravirus salinus]
MADDERIKEGEAAWSARLAQDYAECVIESRRRTQKHYRDADKRATLLDRFFDAITPSHLGVDSIAHWRKFEGRRCYNDYVWCMGMSHGISQITPRPPIH